MQRFGIISPRLGVKTDIPAIMLADAFTPENSNVQMVDQEIRRAKMRGKEVYDADFNQVQTPEVIYAITALAADTFTIAGDHAADFTADDIIRINASTDNDGLYTVVSATFDTDHTDIVVSEAVTTGNVDGNVFGGSTPVLRYHQHVEHSEGLEYLFLLTRYHIWRWIPSTCVLDLLHTVSAGAGCDYWDVISFNEAVIATNDSDAPLRWLSSAAGTDFATLPNTAGVVDKAKFVASFENFVMFGNVTVGATRHPQRINWSNLGDETVWASGDAGSAEVEGSDHISGGFGFSRDFLVIFKEASIHRLWLVTGSDVFNRAPVASVVGCRAPGSVINDADGHLFYYGTDGNLREIERGEMSQAIDSVLRLIPPDYEGEIRSAYVQEYNEVWWAIPYGAAATENNKVLRYKAGTWNFTDIAVSAFGVFFRQTGLVWDSLPYDTWDEWDWETWNSPDGNAGFPIDLCGDYSGYTYTSHGSLKDTGNAYSGWFILATDMTGQTSQIMYKRWLETQLYFVPGPTAVDVTVEVKRDGEVSWQPAGTLTVVGSTDYQVIDLPVDYRAKTFAIRLTVENAFRFIGMVFGFVPSGER